MGRWTVWTICAVSYTHLEKYQYEPQLVVTDLCGDVDELGQGDIVETGPFDNCGKIDYPCLLYTSIRNSPTQKYGPVMPGDIKYKDVNGDGVVDDKMCIRDSTGCKC